MKATKIKPLFALTLGCLLAGASVTASAGNCQSSKMHGKGYYHGMAKGMYGPHGGMYPQSRMYRHNMRYHANPYMKTGASYGQSYGKAANAEEKQTAAKDASDIVSIAAGSDDFETLVTAVKAAGLVETLSTKGPFTVFAPTDEAFAKIPEDQLAALLEDKEALTRVLTYHVVPGTVSSNAVTKLDSAKTVQGGMLTIDTSDGVKINGARVVKADIQASNGIIHVIDTVILPN